MNASPWLRLLLIAAFVSASTGAARADEYPQPPPPQYPQQQYPQQQYPQQQYPQQQYPQQQYPQQQYPQQQYPQPGYPPPGYPPPGYPPPGYPQQYPPGYPQQYPPGYPQQQYAPPTSYALRPPNLVEMERSGHSLKVAGAVLMGVGAGLAVLGMILLVDGVHRSTCVDNQCTHGDEIGGGIVSLLVGGAGFIAGIPTYAVGASRVRRARRLSGLALGPLPGGGAAFKLSLSF